MTIRLDPRNMSLDLLDRAMIRDALAQYGTKRAAQGRVAKTANHIDAARDDAARAADLVHRFNESLK